MSCSLACILGDEINKSYHPKLHQLEGVMHVMHSCMHPGPGMAVMLHCVPSMFVQLEKWSIPTLTVLVGVALCCIAPIPKFWLSLAVCLVTLCASRPSAPVRTWQCCGKTTLAHLRGSNEVTTIVTVLLLDKCAMLLTRSSQAQLLYTDLL